MPKWQAYDAQAQQALEQAYGPPNRTVKLRCGQFDYEVDLDSMVGKPLNIRANEKLVARGEIVVINEKFAVRITDIISPDDRFAAL